MKNGKLYTVSRAHGYDCFKNRGYNPYRREIAENIDYIYSISKKGKMDLEKNLVPLTRNKHLVKIGTSHLGVNVRNIINPVSTDTRVFRIVSCSNVVQIKRLDILAEAIIDLKCNKRALEWIHFGDGELLESIKQIVKSDQLSKNKVIIFRGQTRHDDILTYYKTTHVDLFVNCSDAEGIPVSMMEAMEYGIPCIGRDVGGISELIDNEVNGYLLPENASSKTFTNIIEKLMQTGIAPDIRDNARKKIDKEFNNSRNYRSFASEIVENYGCFIGAKS